MKKFIFPILICLVLFSFSACKPKNEKGVLLLGVNCRVVDIDKANKTLTVEGLEESDKKIFGIAVTLDCKDTDFVKIAEKGEQTQPEFIAIEDFNIGDHITINIYQTEIERIGETDYLPKAKSVQLLNHQ